MAPPTIATSPSGRAWDCGTLAPGCARSRASSASARTACSSSPGVPPRRELPPPRLLGPFDPVLLGWVSREWLLDSHRAVITVNGLFRPFALADARAVAIWSMPAGKVVLDPFARLTRTHAAALRADALDVERYLGDR